MQAHAVYDDMLRRRQDDLVEIDPGHVEGQTQMLQRFGWRQRHCTPPFPTGLIILRCEYQPCAIPTLQRGEWRRAKRPPPLGEGRLHVTPHSYATQSISSALGAANRAVVAPLISRRGRNPAMIDVSRQVAEMEIQLRSAGPLRSRELLSV